MEGCFGAAMYVLAPSDAPREELGRLPVLVDPDDGRLDLDSQ